MDELNILDWLFKVSPVIGVMGWFIWKQEKQISKKDDIIQELNNYAREQDKENLNAMNSIINVMDKLLEDGKKLNTETIKTIKDEAERVADKIINHLNSKQ